MKSRRPADQFLVLHLGPEVNHLEARIGLQAEISRITLPIEDRIDPHGMSVAARGGSYDHELPTNLFMGKADNLIKVELLEFRGVHLDSGEIQDMGRMAVDHEKSELGPDGFGAGDDHALKAHFLCKETGRLLCIRRGRHGKRKRKLNGPVPRVVPVRLQMFEIDWGRGLPLLVFFRARTQEPIFNPGNWHKSLAPCLLLRFPWRLRGPMSRSASSSGAIPTSGRLRLPASPLLSPASPLSSLHGKGLAARFHERVEI